MADLIFRNTSPGKYIGKGSELTFKEADDNFYNLNVELAATSKFSFSKISSMGQLSIDANNKSSELFIQSGPGITISTLPLTRTIVISAATAPNLSVIDDNSNNTMYPMFVSNLGTQQARIDKSVTSLQYVPSTSTLSSTNISSQTLTSSTIQSPGTLQIVPSTTFQNNITALQSASLQSLSVNTGIINIGGNVAPASDDNKDKGVQFRWHNGTTAKTGFFGFDDSTGFFSYIPDAIIANDIVSGTAGTINASVTGSAGRLSTPRAIFLAGDVSGNTTFDGSSNVTINATLSPQILASLPPNPNYATGITPGNGIVVSSVVGGNGRNYTIATDSTASNLVNKVVQRDGSGNFSANIISAQLSGNASSASLAQQAVQLQTARTISLSGDLTGSVQFNGSQNVTLNASLTQAAINQLQTQFQNVILAPFFGANQSLAVNGFQRFPGGLIIQWGRVGDGVTAGGAGSSGTVQFPLRFPNQALSVILQVDETVNNSGATSARLSGGPLTTERFSWQSYTGGSTTQSDVIRWVAIGF